MSEFKKPVGEWIDEYQEVEKLDFIIDEANKTIKPKLTTKKVPIKTQYLKTTESSIDCGNMNHNYYMLDRHKHIAKCRNCAKHRFLRAVYETINSEGHIIDRKTKLLID